MVIQIQEASVNQSYLRLGLAGHDKSGKTFSALEIGTCLIEELRSYNNLRGNGRVCVIDTEHGSASKYARFFNFATISLKNYHPNNYIEAMTAAEKAGFSVIIIDQITHEWSGKGGCLDLHQRFVGEQNKKNTYVAWGKVTPLHEAFIECYLALEAHVICTMREKVKYRQTDGQVVKLGYKPIQRQEVLYEFDAVGQINTKHEIIFTGTRCEAISDKIFTGDNLKERRGPGHKIAPLLAEWLSEGAAVETSFSGMIDEITVRRLEYLRGRLNISDHKLVGILAKYGSSSFDQLSEEDANKLVDSFCANVARNQGVHIKDVRASMDAILENGQDGEVRQVIKGGEEVVYNEAGELEVVQAQEPQDNGVMVEDGPVDMPTYNQNAPITEEQAEDLWNLMGELEPDNDERLALHDAILAKRKVTTLDQLSVSQYSEIRSAINEKIGLQETSQMFENSLMNGVATATETTQEAQEEVKEEIKEEVKPESQPEPIKASKTSGLPKKGVTAPVKTPTKAAQKKK